MVKYEHTYEATPAMIAVPFSKSLSSPASISMLRTQVISTASSLDPTIEEIESIISESPTDLTEDDIIREGTHEDEESRESAPEDADEKEKDEKDKEEKEEEQHENENEKDASEAPASQEFVPDRVDGHTYHEAAMLGLNGTPTAAPNANKKNKKKEGTSLASEFGHSLRGSMQGLKRENSMNKEIKKPTSQAATRAADDNRTTATASSAAAPPANTTVASAPEEDEKDFVLLDFVPHRADGHTYFEAAMLGLNGTPTTANTTGKKKKKAMKMPSFFRKSKK